MIKQSELTVFAFLWITLHHLIPMLKTRECHLGYRVLLVCSLLRGKERRVSGQREVDTREAEQNKPRVWKHVENAYGTRLVWNSFKSTLREPSKRRDAVMVDTT